MRYLLFFFLLACNPVKQVVKDKRLLDDVAKVVIAQGYCVNDTTYIHSSDTLINTITDTLVVDSMMVLNDTTFIYKNINHYKTITIRDTIKSIVVDESRIKLLTLELNDSKSKYFELYKKNMNQKVLLLMIGGLLLLSLIIKLK